MAFRTWIAVSLLTLCSTMALAQPPGEVGYEDIPEMPGGIVGERVQLFIDAVNDTVASW